MSAWAEGVVGKLAKDVTYKTYRPQGRHPDRARSRWNMARLPWLAILVGLNVAVVVYHGDPRDMLARAGDVSKTQRVQNETPVSATPLAAVQAEVLVAAPTAAPAKVEAPPKVVVPAQDPEPPVVTDTELSSESTQSALARLVDSYDPAAGLAAPSAISDNLRITLKRGEMPFDALVNVGLNRGEVSAAFHNFKDLVDFRRIRPGNQFTAWITADGDLRGLDLYQGVLAHYQTRLDGGVWLAHQVQVEKETIVSAVRGEVSISLWDALIKSGEKPALVSLFVEIFAWDIDFFSDVHPGDRFRILVEKRRGNGEFIGYGNILAAEFVQGDDVHRAFAHTTSSSTGDEDLVSYFDENGDSMRKQLLKAPVKYANVTSGFGKRRHPILGYTRTHNGVDYGVPHGTPVWTVGDGRVVRAGRNGGYGNFISIRHANGWVSQYAHLSKIHVRVGQRVSQKETIGAVGSTGMSTGPHLHYELKRDGRFMNPQTQKFARGKALKGPELERFKKTVPTYLQKMSRPAVADNQSQFEPWEG